MALTKTRRIGKIINANKKYLAFDSDQIDSSFTKGNTGGSGTIAIYSSTDNLPVSSTNGNKALVTGNNTLYIYNNGWYKIALINSFNPQWITEPDGSYSLAIDGSTTTITVLANDSDDVPITYTAITDSDFDAFATITHDSDKHNVWTVSPTDSENGSAVSGTGTVTFKASDGVNLVSAVSTFSISFAVADYSSTMLLVKADSSATGTQTDTSGNNLTITQSNNDTSSTSTRSGSFSPYHPKGFSYAFNENNNIIMDTHDDFKLGTGNFEYEFWLRPWDSSSFKFVLDNYVAQGDSWGTDTWAVCISHPSATNKLTFLAYNISSSTNVLASTTTLENGKWYHVVINHSSQTLRMFINGTLEASYIMNSEENIMNPNPATARKRVNIGGGTSSGTNYFLKAWIRDLRYMQLATKTSNFTPPTSSIGYIKPTDYNDTLLLLFNKPYLKDLSGGNKTFTGDGDYAYTHTVGPYDTLGYDRSTHGGAVYFDGTGDYIKVDDDNSLKLGNSDFTIEFWFRKVGAFDASGFETFLFKQISSATSNEWQFDYNSSTNQIRFIPYISGTADTSSGVTSSYIIKNGSWHHIAATRENNILRIYANGTLLKESAFSSTIDSVANSDLYIGARNNNGTIDRDAQGYISDLRIVKGTNVYGDSDFTPPETRLTAITNTSLLIGDNREKFWDAGGTNPFGYTSGNTSITNTQRKWTTSSALYFDGSSDYMRWDIGSLRMIGEDENWTVEGWIYPTTISSDRGFFLFGPSDSGSGSGKVGMGIYESGTTLAIIDFSSGSNNKTLLGSKNQLTVNTWQHIAFVKNGNNATVFINGTISSSGWVSFGSNITLNNRSRLHIGSILNSWYAGYMQDIRITRQIARYTTNFTPPTSEFKG